MARRRKPKENDFSARGERLLSAVERIVDDCDDLIAQVETLSSSPIDEMDLEVASGQIIADYSTRSAIAGGLTSLPALVPGGGTALAIVGGALVDMTFMLKHDVEMILCLTYLHGFDIRDEKERWLAYVLAGIRTHDARAQRNYLADILDVQLDALPKYTPRELFKLASTVLGRLALLSVSRSFVRALPLVGVAVSASTNKFLTTSVGWSCVEALERRRAAVADPMIDPEAVDAVVR